MSILGNDGVITVSRSFNELVDDMGILDFPENEKIQLLEKVGELVLKRIFVEAMEKIGEDGRRDYQDLIEKKAGAEDIRNFFNEKIKNFDTFADDVIDEIRDEMKHDF